MALVCVGGFLAVSVFQRDSFDHLPPERAAPDDPVQEALGAVKTLKKDKFSFRLTHRFKIKALVLSRKNYALGDESDISPVDLALGWGPMSNPNPLKLIRISQGGRFYRFRYDNAPPINHREIELNSANMHMIPANETVARDLKAVNKGDVIEISGYLANVRRDDGWTWNSSTTRADTGRGACEIVYIESIKIYD